MLLQPPFSDLQLDGFIGYFRGTAQDSQDIRALAEAILDKRNGLGLIWMETDFEGIENRISKLPSTHWVTQVGKALLWNVKMLQRVEDGD